MTIHLEINADSDGQRLDRALAAGLADLSRARIQTLIREGRVRIGDRVISDPNHRVNAGDAVWLDLPPPAPATPRAQPIPLDIVYEDDALIVIDKPAGMVVHPGAGTPDGTLVNALLAHCCDSLSGIGGVQRPGIVHRLDKETSGLLVVAKTDRTHAHLSAQFADHGRTGALRRGYKALCWGAPFPARQTIDQPIGRHKTNPTKMAIREDGRHAVTHIAIDERFDQRDGTPIASLVNCRLETGRTHQIRVHLAALGHPILADSVYGAHMSTRANPLPAPLREAIQGLHRQALHAYLLQITHP
ncbi:MAG: RluA family pseudouridine synthase, partial [Pseudomonadota bacterium]